MTLEKFGIILVVVIVFLTALSMRHFVEHKSIGGTLSVGTCIASDYGVESWEKMVIYKILEIGKEHYRTHMYINGSYGILDHSIWFGEHHIVVPCPEEEKS